MAKDLLLYEFLVKQLEGSEAISLNDYLNEKTVDFLFDELNVLNEELRQLSNEIKERADKVDLVKRKAEKYKILAEKISASFKQSKEQGTEINELKFYNASDFTLAEKAEFALSRVGEEMTLRNIAFSIISLETDILQKNNLTFDRFQKNLSATLKQKIDRELMFYRIKDEKTGDFKYGLIKNKKPLLNVAIS